MTLARSAAGERSIASTPRVPQGEGLTAYRRECTAALGALHAPLQRAVAKVTRAEVQLNIKLLNGKLILLL
jgi:hypothetical protein